MKTIHTLRILLCGAIAFSLASTNSLVAQDDKEVKATIPFTSLPVSNIKATGNLATGKLELTMDFENKYDKTAGVSLSLGGFEDMGITSDKGKKYKVYTSENLIGTKDINKGFFKVSAVQFGDKKFDWVTMVQQTIPTGEKRTLSVRVEKYDTTSKVVSSPYFRPTEH